MLGSTAGEEAIITEAHAERKHHSSEKAVRVLLLVNKLGLGGAERVVVNLATHLNPSMVRVDVCATRSGGVLAGEVRAAGVPLHELGKRGVWDLRGHLRLWRLLRKNKFDIVHSHMFGSNVWARLLGHASGVPVVIVHEHTWSYTGNRLRPLIDRVLSPLSDAVVTPSRQDTKAWANVVGVDAGKLRTIWNGVESPKPHSPGLRAELGIPSDVVLIGAIGWMRPQKGYEVLITAMSHMVALQPAVHLVIIGGGGEPERSRLEGLIRDLGLADHVTLLGASPGANALMHDMQIVVNSSHFEGLPLALVEAMSIGKPVVATAVGGVPEVVLDGETGLLSPPGDAAALAALLLRLVEAPALRQRLGDAGYRRYREFFTLERMVENVEELYHSLLIERSRKKWPSAGVK